MTPSDIFTLVGRLLGYLLCLYCFIWVIYSIVGLFGLPQGKDDVLGLAAWISYLAGGIAALLTAGPAARFLYRRES